MPTMGFKAGATKWLLVPWLVGLSWKLTEIRVKPVPFLRYDATPRQLFWLVYEIPINSFIQSEGLAELFIDRSTSHFVFWKKMAITIIQSYQLIVCVINLFAFNRSRHRFIACTNLMKSCVTLKGNPTTDIFPALLTYVLSDWTVAFCFLKSKYVFKAYWLVILWFFKDRGVLTRSVRRTWGYLEKFSTSLRTG